MASQGDDEDRPNAVEQFRTDHPSPYDRAAGDLMPGSLESRDAYSRTAAGLRDFFRVTPAPHERTWSSRRRFIVGVVCRALAVVLTTVLLILAAADRRR